MLKRLSEFKGDEALDVLCEIIDPVDEIIGDEDIKKLFSGKASRLSLAKLILKKHREAAKDIICALGDFENISALSLPFELLKVINDPEIASLFTSLVPGAEKPHSEDASLNRGE